VSAAEHMDTGLAIETEDARTSGQQERASADRSGRQEVQRDGCDLRAGDIVADRYVIDGVIGSGGHGAIHRARHRDLDLPVAVKVLHVGGTTGPHLELVQRFQREARIAARIRHRNVLSVHDTGKLPDGSPFIVMELIEGDDLEHRIARAPISIPAIVDLGRQLFSALAAITEAGVLHRDVKPANVMLHRESDGQMLLKLVDFGIARSRAEIEKLTHTGAIVGTPHYMSPEQLRGEPLDARADMYAASAVLYEAITQRPPFDGAATALVIGQILSAPLTPIRSLRPECPEKLAKLVERGLSRKRADRPSHPMEVVALLDGIVRAEGLAAGALAWAGDPGRTHTAPLDLARRRMHAPNTPPVEEPGESPVVPIEEPEPGLEPERPDHIVDPPPQAPPRKALRRGVAVVAIAACALLGMLAMRGPEPIAADVAAPVALAAPPTPVATTATTTTSAPRPQIDVLLDQGLEALARGEVDAALVHYRAAVIADPTRAEAQRGRGIAAVRAGLDDEAIAAYEAYLSLAPDASDAERIRDRLTAARARRSARLTSTADAHARHGHR